MIFRYLVVSLAEASVIQWGSNVRVKLVVEVVIALKGNEAWDLRWNMSAELM